MQQNFLMGTVLAVLGFAFIIGSLNLCKPKSKVLYKLQGQRPLDRPVLRYRFNSDEIPRSGDANYNEGHVDGLVRGHAIGQMAKIVWDGHRWVHVLDKMGEEK